MSGLNRFFRVYRENWRVALVDYVALFGIIVIVGSVVSTTANPWYWLLAVIGGGIWPALTPRWTLDGDPIDLPWSGWIWDRVAGGP